MTKQEVIQKLTEHGMSRANARRFTNWAQRNNGTSPYPPTAWIRSMNGTLLQLKVPYYGRNQYGLIVTSGPAQRVRA